MKTRLNINKLHVAIVGTVGLPACYGGFESLVDNLVDKCHHEILYTVFSSSKAYPKKIKTYKGANICYVPLNANGAQSILYDIVSLLRVLILRPDITLILGVSGCIFLPIFRLLYRGEIITNIDGLEWKREKWRGWTRLFLKFSERCAVRFSNIVIADNKAITQYVAKEYNIDALTIAYGGDHALKEHNLDSSNCNDNRPYFLSICRIEPENNIDMILEGFSMSPDHHLKFIGTWSRSEYGRNLKRAFSGCRNIEMIEPIYDINVLYQIRTQSIGYVHGHSARGTNPSLVEAMHFGKVIFAYDCNFNRFTTENNCCYFSTAKDLANNIANPHVDSRVIGEKMKTIAMRRYTWNVVRGQYESAYLQLCEKYPLWATIMDSISYCEPSS
ncbi:DUF1972 domain-containing protein [Candidatus Symbiopectobacterium endolongispinus]|nr:DUF1972 domain-containing protein [Candidatus Symbiopectobacterium sp. PLON1]MBT9429743.1 DUF1972 domain-containing protein [Candidatus Symbiopectobacterium endolongispinus]